MSDSAHSEDSVGTHNGYFWVVTQHYISDVLRLCPELVIGKYIAVTACDSGAYRPSSEEEDAGWQSRNDIAYSPMIRDIAALPQAGFDEWYVFDEPANLGQLESQTTNIFEAELIKGHVHRFVNFAGFGLNRLDEWAAVSDLFWRQFGWIRSHSYIGEGVSLNLVTADREVFEAVRTALRRLGDPEPLL